MAADYPRDGAMLMPYDDHPQSFSFTSCPHSSSHGFVCTITHENEDAGAFAVYPSPPPTSSQPKRNVPLPTTTHEFGGILDSPVVLMKAPAPTLLSPPPTIPTPTLALPPTDACTSPDALFSSLLLPIPEHASPESQLLSPISPEWTTNRKPEDELFHGGDSDESVLLSQPLFGAYSKGAYPYPLSPDSGNDGMDCTAYTRPALPLLNIPMYTDHSTEDPNPAGQQSGLLGFTPLIHDESISSPPLDFLPSMSPSATSSLDFLPPPSPDVMSSYEFLLPSPSPTLRDLEYTDSDPKGLGMALPAGPSWLSSPTLISFTSLPSPELDDLDIDMDLGPGPGMTSSPSRRSVTSLPSLDDSESLYDFPAAADWPELADAPESSDVSMSPPHSPPLALTSTPHPNALCLDLPLDPVSAKPFQPPPVLDAFTPAELAARLPPGLPQEELDALLAVRARAQATLAECAAAAPHTSCAPSGLDHELRRSVPRDAGEPRRRRKRAKELGRETDALVGLALGLLPNGDAQPAGKRDAEAARPGVRRDKAGLAGLASVSQLVARMILRRRERCVRGLEGGARRRGRVGSPLRNGEEDEEDGEPPPTAMELDGQLPWSSEVAI